MYKLSEYNGVIFICELHICAISSLPECMLPTATASTLNSVLMRHHELREGIEVVDEDGTVVGTSTIAAKRVYIIIILLNLYICIHYCIYVLTEQSCLFLLKIYSIESCVKIHVYSWAVVVSSPDHCGCAYCVYI